jgi:hypothetical protein
MFRKLIKSLALLAMLSTPAHADSMSVGFPLGAWTNCLAHMKPNKE